MSSTMAPTPLVEHPHISWATYEYMRQKIADLEPEKAQLQADVAHWERETNHWYMKANYTDLELQLMYRRRSRGAGELTGEWRTTAEQSARPRGPREGGRGGGSGSRRRLRTCVDVVGEGRARAVGESQCDVRQRGTGHARAARRVAVIRWGLSGAAHATCRGPQYEGGLAGGDATAGPLREEHRDRPSGARGGAAGERLARVGL